MTGLFIGRFQPMHKGHVSVIESMIATGLDCAVIGIGSSNKQGTPENPWSAEDRRQFIETYVGHLRQFLDIRIVDIPDLDDDERWVAHVDALVGHYDVIYTGNPWVERLMKEANHVVQNIEMRVPISATIIRDALRSGNHTVWREHLHPDLHDYFQNYTTTQARYFREQSLGINANGIM